MTGAKDKPLFKELDPLPEPVREGLPELVEFIGSGDEGSSQEVRIIASRGKTKIDGAFLDSYPELGLVAAYGVGYDRIDAEAAAARGIMVTHTPDVLNADVADLAVALLLCAVRQLPQADTFVRKSLWPQGSYPLTPTLRERTVGLVGMGRIGREIAARISAFGVEVAYHARRPVTDVPYRYLDDLSELAHVVDTMVVIVPGGAATRDLIKADILAALGPNGVLVNVSRGSVVDEGALIEALRDGTILAAGLDVYRNEPHVPDELRGMDNVVLLPHLGSSTLHTRSAMNRLYLDNVAAWVRGSPIPAPVPECRKLNPK